MDVFEKCAELIKAQREIYYNAYEDGKASAGGGGSYDEGFEAGKQAEYDAFWDEFQDKGLRTSYYYGFCGTGWTDRTFKPKYDIIPKSSASYLFQYSRITDLTKLLNDCNVLLSLQKATSATNLFAFSAITNIPVLDLSNATSAGGAFSECMSCHTIEKIIVNPNLKFSSSSFKPCNSIVNVEFEGTLGQNGLDLQWSTKLNKASITSIINALSTTTTGLSITLSLTAVNNAFEGGSTGAEWTTLAGTKNNWTINLV